MLRVRECYDGGQSEASLLDDLCKVDLLVLDEVGIQRGSSGEKVILNQVVDRRLEALEKAQQRIAELERMESVLRPVGVMSQAAYHRLENRESRFIALWPRPEIYLPRKRPDDGVIVYARTAGIQVIEGEQKNG